MNMIRYHGVFAPNFKHRKQIVSAKAKSKKESTAGITHSKIKKERLKWAEMLKKTFEIDVTICPRCNGRLEQIAVIKCRLAAVQILESLKIRTQLGASNAPSTGPPEQLSYENEMDQLHDDW